MYAKPHLPEFPDSQKIGYWAPRGLAPVADAAAETDGAASVVDSRRGGAVGSRRLGDVVGFRGTASGLG